jgi:alpha-L-fucosidase
MLNNTGTSLSYSISGGNITISIPTSAPNSVASVIVVEVSGTPTHGSTSTGYNKIVSRSSGKVLDVAAASTANGATIEQQTDNGGTNQQWSLVATS